ncbi:MAG TPA: proprotein convertase P-domain-containing protein, partial [Ferruginibacter sp.]|nr:proprotein convertase P-domain-containing protein [Ferruginibacter sp.]HMP21865.1 proprotein convertase P-domain-containing protein [Ferruginibacter sp.]
MKTVLSAQSFTGTGGSVPSFGNTPACFSTTVSGVGIIDANYGLAQVCITITHPDVGDLEILLRAPDGTYVPLSMQNGGSGNNFTNTCFTGTATNPIKFGTAPFTGTYKPEGYIGAVNNGQNANGNWSICVTDLRNSGSSGVLNSFTLTFNNTPAPQAPALPACTKTMAANTSCTNASLICDFTGLCGSTSGTDLNWSQLDNAACFGIQNNSFIQFIASATTASFDVWVTSSTGASFTTGGIQMLFFSGTCGGAVTSHGCYAHILASPTAKPLITVITAQGLTIGNTYYMMIDGYNNANTTFTIKAASGISAVEVNPAAPTICAGQNVALTASGGNGVFSWSPPTGLSATTGASVTAAPAATTTYTVSSTSPTGCPISKEVTVTVTPGTPPVTDFSYDKISACSNSANPVLQPGTGFTTGGIFTATPAGLSINSSTGAINVAASTAGDYTITYSIPASGCYAATSSTFAFSVYTNTLPITGFRYLPATVCGNGSNPTLDKDLAFTPGGTYSSVPGGLNINSVTGDINLTSSSSGSYKIYYTVPASGCTLAGIDSTVFTIIGATTPVTDFSYTPNTICTGGANPVLNPIAGFTTGGVFSASPSGLNINTATGAINVAASSPGTYTITYAVVANGCSPAQSSTATITITTAITPVTGFNYQTNPVCNCDPALNLVLPVNNFTTGGIFTATPAGLSIDPVTGTVNPGNSAVGNYTVTYTVAASGCVTAQSSEVSLKISSCDASEFNYSPNTVCPNDANPLLLKAVNFEEGGVYSAAPAGLSINPATGAINVAASNPGSYTITYDVSAVSPCLLGIIDKTYASFTINTGTTPVTGFSYSTTGVCQNGNNPAINTSTGFTTGGIFTATPAGLNINANTGAIDVGASSPGDYTISYTVTASGCAGGGSSQTTFSVYSIGNPITSFSYTPNSICAGGANPALTPSSGFTSGG